jgi:1-acyl-sn-glycerol-3-phosphate acyltransferase
VATALVLFWYLFYSKIFMSYEEAKHPRLYGMAHRRMSQRGRRKLDLSVKGAEHIPQSGAALLGYSHRESSDPWVAGVAIPDRPVHLMAKHELWKLKYAYIGYGLQLIGAFPVNRENPGHSTIKHARQLLKDQKLVGVFGEESRYENPDLKIVRGETIGEISEGLGYLAVMNQIAIYPVGISHLTPEKIEEFGRDVKRVVVSGPDRPNLTLPKEAAIADILERHRMSLQSAFDEANESARTDATIKQSS